MCVLAIRVAYLAHLRLCVTTDTASVHSEGDDLLHLDYVLDVRFGLGELHCRIVGATPHFGSWVFVPSGLVAQSIHLRQQHLHAW